MKSDFLLDLSIPWSDMEGGYNWFLRLKNMAISASRNWLTKYKRINKLTSFFNPSGYFALANFLIVWN